MTAVETGRPGTSGRLADLTLHVDGYELTGRKLAASERSTRLTTVVMLHGAGHREVREDTTYTPPARLAFRNAGTVLPLAGDWSLNTFSPAWSRWSCSPRALPTSAPSGDGRSRATRSTSPSAQAVLNLAALRDDFGRSTLARVQRRVAASPGAPRSTSSGSTPCLA
jgi:hypothetical protein